MGRRSPIGIDGVSITWLDRIQGRPRTVKVRVRDEAGTYKSRTFPVVSYTRNGDPQLPVEATKWARSKRGAYLAGTDSAGSADLRVVLSEWVQNAGDRGVTPEVIRRIQLRTKAAIRQAGHNLKAPNWRARVQGWMRTIEANWWDLSGEAPHRRRDQLALSPVTKNAILRDLRTVIGYAVESGRITRDPTAAIRPWKEPSKLKALFSLSELRHLVSDEARYRSRICRGWAEQKIAEHGTLAAAAEALGCHLSTLSDKRRHGRHEDPWWLPACLMIYTGCRVQEAFHLRWEWIQWDESVIEIRLRDDFRIKGMKERRIPFEAELRAILMPIRQDEGWIIANEHLRTTGSISQRRRTKEPPHKYSKAFARYLKRVGIERGDRTPHSLRHCYATLKIAHQNQNLDRLRKSLGHDDLKTTQGYSEQSQAYEAVVDTWPDPGLHLRR